MIDYHAYRILRGDCGGPDRRDHGPLYEPIQNEVNRQLGYRKSHYYW